MKFDAHSLSRAWAQRHRRERGMICAAALVLSLLLADTFVWNPWRMKMKALAGRQAQAQLELERLSGLQDTMTPKDAQILKQMEALRRRLEQVDRLTVEARAQVISPQRMSAKLREVTELRGPVNVVALRSLPAAPMADSGATRLFRHAFELHVEGSYADIARYVETLERTAGELRWSAVELDAQKYPAIAARLEVFTLSEQSSWIQL